MKMSLVYVGLDVHKDSIVIARQGRKGDRRKAPGKTGME